MTVGQNFLTFVSGQPTLDAVEEIVVRFMEEPTKKLLEADSCFNKVVLPLIHNEHLFTKCF